MATRKKKSPAKTRSAATVVIRDAENMTPKGRRQVAAWLKRQAGFLLKYHKALSPRFTARYMYATGK